VQASDRIRLQKRAMIERYTRSDNLRGLVQVGATLVPMALLWWLAVTGGPVSHWITAGCILLLILFNLRVFALMHECGHGSLFRSRRLNRAIGFVLGVLAGMPQYVWSQHHNYHHAHNGNWDKYRGPYATLSVSEYAAMTHGQQRRYRQKCSLSAAPLAGFIYLIFTPRFTWIRGTLALLNHLVRAKFSQPHISHRQHAWTFKSRYWKSRKEYWHMFWNNVVLLAAWILMSWLCGVALFFSIYLVSLSIAGGAGIVLFTVQHNFEHAYASDDRHWSYDTGAIKGTSFLILPSWLNWFTVNIGYHHIHHLSASIPNYLLVKCHDEYEHLFPDVTRVKLGQIHRALKCILWDSRAQQIISVAEYQRGVSALQGASAH
jgi:acyl-lipid omega-6 desaturase (Delta-12 desaturase)